MQSDVKLNDNNVTCEGDSLTVNGDLTAATITAASGTINGDLTAASGTINGVLRAHKVMAADGGFKNISVGIIRGDILGGTDLELVTKRLRMFEDGVGAATAIVRDALEWSDKDELVLDSGAGFKGGVRIDGDVSMMRGLNIQGALSVRRDMTINGVTIVGESGVTSAPPNPTSIAQTTHQLFISRDTIVLKTFVTTRRIGVGAGVLGLNPKTETTTTEEAPLDLIATIQTLQAKLSELQALHDDVEKLKKKVLI